MRLLCKLFRQQAKCKEHTLRGGLQHRVAVPTCSERLLPTAAVTKIADLYKDLHVHLQDGTGRQGAIRSTVIEKYFIVQIGAVVVLFSRQQPRVKSL